MSAPGPGGSGPPPSRPSTANLFIASKRVSRLPPANGAKPAYSPAPAQRPMTPASASNGTGSATRPTVDTSSAARFANGAASAVGDVDMEWNNSPATATPTSASAASRLPSRLPPSASGSAPSRLPLVNTGLTPATPPSLSSQQQLEKALSRLVNVLPSVIESQQQQPPLLDGLLLDASGKEGLERAWREKERKEADTRAQRVKLAYEHSGRELLGVLKREVEGAEFGRRLKVVEDRLASSNAAEIPYTAVAGTSTPADSSASTTEFHRLLSDLRTRIIALEAAASLSQQAPTAAQLAAQREEELADLTSRIKADLAASYEQKFQAMEARLSALATPAPCSAPATSTSTPARPPPAAKAVSTEFCTRSDLLQYAKKTDSTLSNLEAKGRNLAQGVGVEWSTSEKVLGKRRADGEQEGSEKGETLVTRLEKLGLETGAVKERVTKVEGKVERFEKGGPRPKDEQSGGDVSMQDGEKETIISDLKHRLGSLETDFAALKYASLSPTTTASALHGRVTSLEASLSTLRTSLESLGDLAVVQTELKKISELEVKVEQVEGHVQRADQKFGDHAKRFGDLASYFTTNNRMLALDSIVTAWQTQNPPPAASAQLAANNIATGQAPTPPEERRDVDASPSSA